MLDDTVAGAAVRSPVAAAEIGAPRRRRRALAGWVALVLLLHGAFLGGAASVSPTGAVETGLAPMSVRTVAIEPEASTVPSASVAETQVLAPPVTETLATPVVVAPPRLPRRPSKPQRNVELGGLSTEAGARLEEVDAVAAAAFAVAEVAPEPAANVAATATVEHAASASAALPPLLLEARIAGLTLLIQTSEGGIDATGLAPVRFVDQRARRRRRPPTSAAMSARSPIPARGSSGRSCLARRTGSAG